MVKFDLNGKTIILMLQNYNKIGIMSIQLTFFNKSTFAEGLH